MPNVPDNPNYSQDADGQWWYQTKKARFRCKTLTCEACGSEFIRSPMAAHAQRFCGRYCAGKTVGGGGAGPNGTRWKGGETVRRGYVMVWMPDHHSIPPGTQRKYVLKHRLVMEEVLGRPLLSAERVHHINGVRDDNRPENLELWTTGHSMPGVRASDVKHCPTCTCGEHA